MRWADVAEVAAVIGVTVLVIRELERSEQKELRHQAVTLARQKANRDWWQLVSQCGAMIRRAVSRWAWSKDRKRVK